jgi:N-acetylglucosamine kinase-like BadF-type ATPase
MGPMNDSALSGLIVAIDGGGSKTDAVALTREGQVVARTTGPGSSPHFLGVDESVRQIDELVLEVAGAHRVEQANLYLSGLDLPSEVDIFTGAISHLSWATPSTILENDLFALLRAGTAASDAVAVVCGSGINAVGRRADGASARFAALGLISGDWGGGTGIGESALWHAVRGSDLRGPSTTLTAAIPPIFGLTTIDAVTQAFHLHTLEYGDLGLLSPLVFDHADAGDAIAGRIIERQGEEIALMAASCIERLSLAALPVPVVLGGGVLSSRHPGLLAAIRATLEPRCPKAVIHHVAAPPIVGAALLALETVGASESALARAREELRA